MFSVSVDRWWLVANSVNILWFQLILIYTGFSSRICILIKRYLISDSLLLDSIVKYENIGCHAKLMLGNGQHRNPIIAIVNHKIHSYILIGNKLQTITISYFGVQFTFHVLSISGQTIFKSKAWPFSALMFHSSRLC